MATNFPGALDNGTSLPYPAALSKRNSPSLASLSDNQNDSIIATQTKLGIGASTPTNNFFLVGTGVGTSAWTKAVPTGAVVGTTDTQNISNKTFTSSTFTSPIITNANITTDLITGFTTSNSGSIFGISVVLGNISSALTLNSTLTVSGNATLNGTLSVASTSTLSGAITASSTLSTVGQISTQTATAPPAAGATTAGIKLSSTANFGVFFGNGAPTFSAAQGSLYLSTSGSSSTTRAYINTTGSTTWTAVSTVA